MAASRRKVWSGHVRYVTNIQYSSQQSTGKLPDPDDRHVVAAALEAEADYVVTFNLRDFPRQALESLAIQAIHPDAFVADLASQRPGDVLEIMRRHRASLRKPPRSRAEYVDLLRRAGLEQTSRILAEQRGEV